MNARTILTDDFTAATSQTATLHEGRVVTNVRVVLHPQFNSRVPQLLLSSGQALHLDTLGIHRESSVAGDVETVKYVLDERGRDVQLTLTRPAGAYAGRTMVTNRLIRHT
jgi:hypothetical protein